jgi:hypothetical protein
MGRDHSSTPRSKPRLTASAAFRLAPAGALPIPGWKRAPAAKGQLRTVLGPASKESWSKDFGWRQTTYLGEFSSRRIADVYCGVLY